MRARNLKPGFFCNEQLSECSFQARILFAGLWCLADRKGVLQDRPKRIKAAVFPLDDISAADVQAMMDDLEQHGLIMRYDADDGAALVYIPTFSKHQNPHPREKESELPLPADGSREKVRRAPNLEGHASPVRHVAAAERCGAAVKRHGAAGLNPDVLNPDVLNPESGLPESAPSCGPMDQAKEFALTPEGLSQAWTIERHGHPGAKEEPRFLADEIREAIRLGTDPAQLLAAIKSRDRDHSEQWWQFKRREIESKRAGPARESPMERGRRLAAKVGALRGESA